MCRDFAGYAQIGGFFVSADMCQDCAGYCVIYSAWRKAWVYCFPCPLMSAYVSIRVTGTNWQTSSLPCLAAYVLTVETLHRGPIPFGPSGLPLLGGGVRTCHHASAMPMPALCPCRHQDRAGARPGRHAPQAGATGRRKARLHICRNGEHLFSFPKCSLTGWLRL